MNDAVTVIPFSKLLLSFVPGALVLLMLRRWTAEGRTAAYALARMVAQLLLVGYVLTFLFAADHPLVVVVTLTAMLLIASWIALRPLGRSRAGVYPRALLAIAVGAVTTLILITQLVLDATPWYQARLVIPLAGMVLAASMNTVSLAGERFAAERQRGVPHVDARAIALRSALIPQINSLFAVGLVSLPGMMTGQILSGVPALIAVRYQIMVMSMLFGAAGASAVCYLALCGAKQSWTPSS